MGRYLEWVHYVQIVAPTVEVGALNDGPVAFEPCPHQRVAADHLQVCNVLLSEKFVVLQLAWNEDAIPLDRLARPRILIRELSNFPAGRIGIDITRFDPLMSGPAGISCCPKPAGYALARAQRCHQPQNRLRRSGTCPAPRHTPACSCAPGKRLRPRRIRDKQSEVELRSASATSCPDRCISPRAAHRFPGFARSSRGAAPARDGPSTRQRSFREDQHGRPIRRASRPSCRRRGRRRRKPRTPGTPAGPFAAPVEAPTRWCTQWRRSRHPRSLRILYTRHVFRLPLIEGCRNSGSANNRRARDLTGMLNRRKARMAEGSRGLGHLVTPADWLARIAHDPQHVCERQLAGCGCFLPYLLVCTAGCSLGAASARPFSPVSVHRAIARLIEPRALRSVSGSLVPQYGTARSAQRFSPPGTDD